MSTKNTDRGTIREIIMVVDYPDGTTKIAHVDPSNLTHVVLDPAECERLASPEVWKTPNWRDNPAFVMVKQDGTVVAECRPIDHPPPPSDDQEPSAERQSSATLVSEGPIVS